VADLDVLEDDPPDDIDAVDARALVGPNDSSSGRRGAADGTRLFTAPHDGSGIREREDVSVQVERRSRLELDGVASRADEVRLQDADLARRDGRPTRRDVERANGGGGNDREREYEQRPYLLHGPSDWSAYRESG